MKSLMLKRYLNCIIKVHQFERWTEMKKVCLQNLTFQYWVSNSPLFHLYQCFITTSKNQNAQNMRK